jgi:hypothetical protein
MHPLWLVRHYSISSRRLPTSFWWYKLFLCYHFQWMGPTPIEGALSEDLALGNRSARRAAAILNHHSSYDASACPSDDLATMPIHLTTWLRPEGLPAAEPSASGDLLGLYIGYRPHVRI